MQSIMLSTWGTAEKLGVEEHTISSLSTVLPHIVVANERLFPAQYVEACAAFLKHYELKADPSTLAKFRDTQAAPKLVRATQRALGTMFLERPTDPDSKRRLSTRTVAKLLGVNPPTLDRWKRQGFLPEGELIPKASLNVLYRWVL